MHRAILLHGVLCYHVELVTASKVWVEDIENVSLEDGVSVKDANICVLFMLLGHPPCKYVKSVCCRGPVIGTSPAALVHFDSS